MIDTSPAFQELEVPLPQALSRFGGSVSIQLGGDPSGPLVAAMGGISGNRFVGRGPSGGPGWWQGLVGDGCAIDLKKHHVLGLDFAADPTGRHAPSTHDQAIVLAACLDAVGLQQFDLILGASYGGMVALAFAELFPSRVCKLAIVSAAAEPHPVATATRELQRRVVALGLARGAGDEALSIARGMAMMSYRSPEEYAQRFKGGLAEDDPLAATEPGRYLRARGEAFQRVMSPGRFLSLSGSIDRHRVDPGRIRTRALLVGANSDQLVPPSQMRLLATALAGEATLHLRDCLYGHDMFLKEAAEVGGILQDFLGENR
jgi:homoserine O-acetyltransferase